MELRNFDRSVGADYKRAFMILGKTEWKCSS